jgi:hypothetical protein
MGPNLGLKHGDEVDYGERRFVIMQVISFEAVVARDVETGELDVARSRPASSKAAPGSRGVARGRLRCHVVPDDDDGCPCGSPDKADLAGLLLFSDRSDRAKTVGAARCAASSRRG